MASSIQFDEIDSLDGPRLGLLWASYRSRYPHLEQHPPLAEIKEDFGPPGPAGIRVTLTEMLPTPRSWYLNNDGTRLLQVQTNRFVLNWRKLDTEENYPRYSSIRSSLLEEFRIFEEFLQQEELGQPKPNQIELTYVNHLPAVAVDGTPISPDVYIRLWAGLPADAGLPMAEEVQFQTRHLITGPRAPLGRLYIKFESRYRISDSSPLYALSLIARGAPISPSVDGVLSFLDLAHEWIVNTFAFITTDAAHLLWERTK